MFIITRWATRWSYITNDALDQLFVRIHSEKSRFTWDFFENNTVTSWQDTHTHNARKHTHKPPIWASQRKKERSLSTLLLHGAMFNRNVIKSVVHEWVWRSAHSCRYRTQSKNNGCKKKCFWKPTGTERTNKILRNKTTTTRNWTRHCYFFHCYVINIRL